MRINILFCSYTFKLNVEYMARFVEIKIGYKSEHFSDAVMDKGCFCGTVDMLWLCSLVNYVFAPRRFSGGRNKAP